jgi:hypothetical protein
MHIIAALVRVLHITVHDNELQNPVPFFAAEVSELLFKADCVTPTGKGESLLYITPLFEW